jgi:putative ABC transport system ATP-binding protein
VGLSTTGDDEPGGALAGLESLYVEPERPTEIDWGALEFHDVFKIYRSGPAETVALRGLDLRIEPREMAAIIGPSGSGKSTLLALAAAMDTPSAGEVRAVGRSLARFGEAELAGYRAREIAIVFQSDNLWPALSARENVATVLRLAGRDDAENAASEALEAFGLGDRQHLRPSALSGGEQQRVAIAAAAARRAPLALADEPTGELDERNEAIVLEALHELRDVYGSTILVVTHSDRVAGACDRVVSIRDGRVEV